MHMTALSNDAMRASHQGFSLPGTRPRSAPRSRRPPGAYRASMGEVTITETPLAAGPGGMTVVDVTASYATGDGSSHAARVPAQREETGQAPGTTCRERARYEREVAMLDLTDAAQAMAQAQAGENVDAPVDSSQVDLATGLYASADRHRRLAERFESGDSAPGVRGEMP